MSQNNIDSIAEGFVFHHSLTNLACWLTSSSISGPSGIRRICRCQRNHLWRWWMYRRNPQLIQTVNLTSNRLPHLHGRTFAGNVRRTLRNLYLAHNLLTRVPRFFFNLPNYKSLRAPAICIGFNWYLIWDAYAKIAGKLLLVWKILPFLIFLTTWSTRWTG